MSEVAWRRVRARGKRGGWCHPCPRSAPWLPASGRASPGQRDHPWALNLCSASPACGAVFCLFVSFSLFFFFFACLFCLQIAISVVPFEKRYKYKQPSQGLQQAQPAERVSRALEAWGLWQGDPGHVGWQSCRWHLRAPQKSGFHSASR